MSTHTTQSLETCQQNQVTQAWIYFQNLDKPTSLKLFLFLANFLSEPLYKQVSENNVGDLLAS